MGCLYFVLSASFEIPLQDVAGVPGSTVKLQCSRQSDAQRLVWTYRRFDEEDEEILYNTEHPLELPDENDYVIEMYSLVFLLYLSHSLSFVIFLICKQDS